MPTGYTAAIEDGITFNQFAMQCARAFGACVMLRDEPFDAPIPEELKPSEWYRNKVAEAQARLESLEAMSPAGIETAALHAYLTEHEGWKKYTRERAQLNDKYREMLVHVNAWTPPTDEHKPMQRFMVEQLEMSILDYTSPEPQMKTGAKWHIEETLKAMKGVAYYAKNDADEQERVNSRNAWLKALRESLSSSKEI